MQTVDGKPIDLDQALYCKVGDYYFAATIFMPNGPVETEDADMLYPATGSWIRAGTYYFNPKSTTLYSVECQNNALIVNVKAGKQIVFLSGSDAKNFLLSWWSATRLSRTWDENVDDILYFQKISYRLQVKMMDGRTILLVGDNCDKLLRVTSHFKRSGDYYLHPKKVHITRVSAGQGVHWLEVVLSVGVTVYDEEAGLLLN
ncbi:MAG: hypothetical protein E6Q36_00180 [Chryseobacterium sp.]|nr:MAG: hypothetical protein E6Q36_00180 [Chryseobacterium sp.]